MCECTPPSLTRPIRCSWRVRPRSMASTNSGWREKFAAGDELVDARDVHLHDAAGADIQMADFAVAHLALGQADERAGGVDQRVGKILEQAVVIGFAREGDGVAFGFGAVAPAVKNGEDDGSRAFRHGWSA